MRSFVVAVLFFAGILAYSNAIPQYGLNEALIDLAKELAKEDRNSTIKFGNNTVIITGIANSNANINRIPNQRPQKNEQPSSNGWNYGSWNYYPGYGFWRTAVKQNETESIEDIMSMSDADMKAEEEDDQEEASLDKESEEDDKRHPNLQSDEVSEEELSHENDTQEDEEPEDSQE
ncbi:uncharacterized protein Dwil_GK16789 [Drosophila willistoni]|uniref:Uncharacterized protein n=1 Tax=Drosophila willistoni TaxID=7260 RepID=B4MLW1_DROWI|nr:uncharacterized protein LOC6638621 [Drosophila willistoni]EDW73172.1 uncharacterized protein Dwil_GK16789 [Drosophila willistoni]